MDSKRNKSNGKSKYYTDKPQIKTKRANFVPVHLRVCSDHRDLRLVSQYYPDLDTLIIKCPNKFCDQPSAEIVEEFKATKERRRKTWLKNNSQATTQD